jgi:hypothetical protein
MFQGMMEVSDPLKQVSDWLEDSIDEGAGYRE